MERTTSREVPVVGEPFAERLITRAVRLAVAHPLAVAVVDLVVLGVALGVTSAAVKHFRHDHPPRVEVSR